MDDGPAYVEEAILKVNQSGTIHIPLLTLVFEAAAFYTILIHILLFNQTQLV